MTKSIVTQIQLNTNFAGGNEGPEVIFQGVRLPYASGTVIPIGGKYIPNFGKKLVTATDVMFELDSCPYCGRSHVYTLPGGNPKRLPDIRMSLCIGRKIGRKKYTGGGDLILYPVRVQDMTK